MFRKCRAKPAEFISVKQAKVLSVRFPKEYDHINLAAKHPKLCTYFTPNFLICNFSIHISIHTSIHTSTHTYMHACIHIRKFRHGWGMRRVPSKTTKLGRNLREMFRRASHKIISPQFLRWLLYVYFFFCLFIFIVTGRNLEYSQMFQIFYPKFRISPYV